MIHNPNEKKRKLRTSQYGYSKLTLIGRKFGGSPLMKDVNLETSQSLEKCTDVTDLKRDSTILTTLSLFSKEERQNKKLPDTFLIS